MLMNKSRRIDQGTTLVTEYDAPYHLFRLKRSALGFYSFVSTLIMYMFWIVLLLIFPLLSISRLIPGSLPNSFVEPLHDPPLWHIHAYNNNTYILRQSGLTDYEKPFLYLLFGNEKAYLFDTGSL